MPALPKLKIDALAELARQLRYESPEAARRQLERAETLTLEILAECGAPVGSSATTQPVAGAPRRQLRTYPLEYIIFRITGMRSEFAAEGSDGASPIVLVGEALLADLPALVERLSTAARIGAPELTAADHPPTATRPSSREKLARSRAHAPGDPSPPPALVGPWLSIDDLAKHWNIGRKTIERLRRRGLLARRVRVGGSGRGAAVRERLVFSATAVRAFEAAGGFTRTADARDGRPRPASQTIAARAPRLTDTDRRRIIARAQRYQGRFGWSLNRCAARIAAGMKRSHETVRRVLRAHDAAADTPIFDERGRLGEHERTVLERSKRAGASPTQIAAKISRTRSAVYRIAADRRAERLRALDLDAPVGPLFDRPDAAEVILAPVTVRTGLGDPAPATVGEFVALCDSMDPPAAAVETARAVAYAYLRHRARDLVRALPRHGAGAADLDEIETTLRWASRIKAELIRSQLPTALRSLRARLDGRGPESLAPRGPAGGPALIDACIAALIDSVDRFDPFKALAGGGRLAAPAAIAVNRALTRWLQGMEQSGRGRAAHKSESAPLADWTLRVDPWQDWLEAPESLSRTARDARTAPPSSAVELHLVQSRFGFLPTGAPPMTLVDTARALGIVPQRIAAKERLAIAAAIGGNRSATDSTRRRGKKRGDVARE
jgi:hypothetical protein